jgi:TetR/AcrR family transcriptional repressor of bet genes
MSRRGYDGASIADIARAAELTPGLVHHHFDNKQEILLVALEQLVARHEKNLDEYLSTAGSDPVRQVAAFIDLHLGLGATADPEALACWVLISGEALRQPEVGVEFDKAIARLIERLRTIIQRGIDDGSFACNDAEAAAAAIFATIQGYLVLAAAARRRIPRGSAAPSTLAMTSGLLRPSRPIGNPRGDR